MENSEKIIDDFEGPVDEFSLNVFYENVDDIHELSEEMKQKLTLKDEEEQIIKEAPTSASDIKSEHFVVVFYNLPVPIDQEKLRVDLLRTLKISHLKNNDGKKCLSMLDNKCYIKNQTCYEYRLRRYGKEMFENNDCQNIIKCCFILVYLKDYEEAEFLRNYWNKRNYFGNKLVVFWSRLSRDQQKPINGQQQN